VTVTDLHPPVTVPEPMMADLESWVTEWLTGILERRAHNTRRWCAYWWDHPEAVTRMWLLFHGHRQVVDHGSALDQAAWMLDHLDRAPRSPVSTDGPFASCAPDRHWPHRGLSVAPMPEIGR
jgi:hypothetical protein